MTASKLFLKKIFPSDISLIELTNLLPLFQENKKNILSFILPCLVIASFPKTVPLNMYVVHLPVIRNVNLVPRQKSTVLITLRLSVTSVLLIHLNCVIPVTKDLSVILSLLTMMALKLTNNTEILLLIPGMVLILLPKSYYRSTISFLLLFVGDNPFIIS